ncbi:MAG: gluconate 2-dehydrogenase subunit 3 family protein [Spirochaetes bacterium]|nr:gluconate 2-dehydrogenase subunit 3 family protein [Spirochaetota bacterium]
MSTIYVNGIQNKHKIFNQLTAKIMHHVMCAIIPQGGAFPKGAADYNLLSRVEEIIRSYNPAIQRVFYLALRYLEYEPLFYKGKRFSALSLEEASEILEKMEQSNLYYRRMIVLMMKLLTCLAFYEIDENAKQIGYTHGCHLKKHAKTKRTRKK